MKKITRRSVLRLSGLAAASLALTSCRAAGSAAVGSRFLAGSLYPFQFCHNSPLLVMFLA